MKQPHRLTVVTPAMTTDRRGDTQLSYGDDATRTEGVPAWLQQFASSESYSTDRDERQTTWNLLSTATPTLTSLDQIEWGDLTFTIAGEPNHLTTPNGYHHTEAKLLLVAG